MYSGVALERADNSSSFPNPLTIMVWCQPERSMGREHRKSATAAEEFPETVFGGLIAPLGGPKPIVPDTGPS